MKLFKKIFIMISLIVAVVYLFVASSLGYIPGVSKWLGTDKPKDLGVRYTVEDKASARAKSQLEYLELPAYTPVEESIVRKGSRPITTSWNSAEMTALLNDRPWLYWPIKNVQLKINDDGTAELSGVVDKVKFGNYATAVGIPATIAKAAATFMPANSAFYIKAKTSLENNVVKDFDIQSLTYGKIIIPPSMILSYNYSKIISSADAASPTDPFAEVVKYSSKKEAIISFISDRLSLITGFYAKSAYFKDGNLYFNGTLSQSEATVR
jgi:hypothetical protein